MSGSRASGAAIQAKKKPKELVQRLRKIGLQVAQILDPDRNADQIGRNTCVRLDGVAMFDKALNPAQRGRALKKRQLANHAQRVQRIAFRKKGQQIAVAALHLHFGHRMAAMRRQARIIDGFDGRMRQQPFGGDDIDIKTIACGESLARVGMWLQ